MSNNKGNSGKEKAKFFENFEYIRILRGEYEMSFRKIARKLGMNYQTVYHYFKLTEK